MERCAATRVLQRISLLLLAKSGCGLMRSGVLTDARSEQTEGINMSKHERILLLLAIALGSVVLLPATIFVLIALWPQRVLVSWLLLGLVASVVLARIAVWIVRAVTTAKVRLAEESLRPGRLYAHERLVKHKEGNSYEGVVPLEAWQEHKLRVQTPYSSGEKLVPHSYDGLAPLMMEREQEWP